MDGWDISQTTRNARAPGGAKNRYRIIKTIKKVKDTKNRYRMKGIG